MNLCKYCRLFRRNRCCVNPIARRGVTPGCDLFRDTRRLL